MHRSFGCDSRGRAYSKIARSSGKNWQHSLKERELEGLNQDQANEGLP